MPLRGTHRRTAGHSPRSGRSGCLSCDCIRFQAAHVSGVGLDLSRGRSTDQARFWDRRRDSPLRSMLSVLASFLAQGTREARGCGTRFPGGQSLPGQGRRPPAAAQVIPVAPGTEHAFWEVIWREMKTPESSFESDGEQMWFPRSASGINEDPTCWP